MMDNSDESVNGTVVNRTCHSMNRKSYEVTFVVFYGIIHS